MQKMILIISVFFMHSTIHGQTFTMGNKCYDQNKKGMSLLKEKKYKDALSTFTPMEKSCTTKDPKEAIEVGKAKQLNAFERNNKAITASNAALKVTKNNS